MTDDIVARLRDCDGGYFMRKMFAEAADEIERLRELSGDAGQLREERDEARRGWCMARAVIRWDIEHPNSPQRTETTIILLAWQIADEEGWNCFEGRKR